jgi:hypothetical protein
VSKKLRQTGRKQAETETETAKQVSQGTENRKLSDNAAEKTPPEEIRAVTGSFSTTC